MKLNTALITAMTVAPIGVESKGVRGLRKLQVQLVGYGGQPNPNRIPLGQCEGDCDNDGECRAGLVCYQRGSFEEVPGCVGGGDFPANTDFCVSAQDLAMQETMGPTWSPTFSPTTVGTEAVTTMGPTTMVTEEQYDMSLPELEYVGDNLSGMPLGLCQGDCDVDEDCIDELVCFQRDYDETIPGCRPGQDFTSVDYCVLPPTPEVITTMAPTETATFADTESGTEFVVALYVVGDAVGTPLGLCQGDCDTNDDCLDELICFQRNGFEPVPGCVGQGSASYDYCIMDPDATPSPTMSMSATSAPTESTAPPTFRPMDVVVQAVEAPTPSPTIALPLLATVTKDTIGILGLCQGDCGDDDDCAEGLICLQRDRGDVVPGCAGEPNKGADYCVYPF